MMVYVDSRTVEARFIWRAVIVLAIKAALDKDIDMPVIFEENGTFTIEEDFSPRDKLAVLCEIQGSNSKVCHIIFQTIGEYVDRVTCRMMRKWRQLKRIETDGAYLASFVEEA